MAEIELSGPGIAVGGPEAKSEALEADPTRSIKDQLGIENLIDQIVEIRFEVQRMRSDTAGVKEELVDRIVEVDGGLRVEMAGVKEELVDRIVEVDGGLRVEMAGMRAELVDRIVEVDGGLRAEMAGMKKSLGNWMALGISFITVLMTLIALLR